MGASAPTAPTVPTPMNKIQDSQKFHPVTSNSGEKSMGLLPLVQNYLQICYNSLSLQQWYQVNKGFYPSALYFSPLIVAILKKIHFILAVSATGFILKDETG